MPKFAGNEEDAKVPEVARSKRAVELAALREERTVAKAKAKAEGLPVEESSEDEVDDDVDINPYEAMMTEHVLKVDSAKEDSDGALEDLLL
jgi:hypothetical protein